jgi:hypothetical protein
MNNLPKNFAILGGIVTFCAAEMLCLLRDNPPLTSLKRAGTSALIAAAVIWICGLVAISVLQEGLKPKTDSETETKE